jgi:hypothetical protein
MEAGTFENNSFLKAISKTNCVMLNLSRFLPARLHRSVGAGGDPANKRDP